MGEYIPGRSLSTAGPGTQKVGPPQDSKQTGTAAESEVCGLTLR